MVKMLIVDDRPDVTEYISTLGNWNEIGVEIVGCAYDGVQALEKLERYRPHILLTDIRMPLMDGLELTKQAKELIDGIIVILLSSYGDFSYAQKAISFGAHEYILKPAKIEVIKEVVLKYCEKIQNVHKEYYEKEVIRKKLKESMPLLKNEYLIQLCQNQYNKNELMEERLNYLGIAIDTDHICVIMFVLDDAMESNSLENEGLLLFSIINIIEETAVDFGKAAVFSSRENEVVCILNAEAGTGIPFEFAKTAQSYLQNFLGVSVSAGIGRIYAALTDAFMSYREAVLAVQNRFIQGNHSIISIGNVEISREASVLFPIEMEKLFLEYLMIGLKEKTLEEYKKIVNYMQEVNRGNPQIIKSYLIQLVTIISRNLLEKDIYFETILGSEYDYIYKMEEVSSIDRVNQIFEEIILSICDYISESRKKNEESTVRKITQYIKLNYRDSDISLSKFSKEYYISTSNLSQMIKQSLGETFIEYITKLRIERAKILLLSEEKRVYEVAEEVGYTDRRYFSELFKKYTGVTPSEYVENNRR